MKAFFSCMAVILITVSLIFAEDIFRYNAKGKRDPFMPLISKDGIYLSDAYGIKSMRDIRLEGIVWDGTENSVAIINGEIIGEGGVLGNAKVLKIEKSGVIFDIDGERVRIDLDED